MQLKLSGKGLFVFSDPGGAKPVLSLVKSWENSLRAYRIISDRIYGFYKEFGLQVELPSGNAAADISSFQPDFIFTGTSYTSKIEWNYLKEANRQHIPTYAFVDHWTNIRERFDNDGEEVLPGKLCLIDDRAKKIAISQGIPEATIVVTGNPFQDYLRLWRPTVDRETFFSGLGIETSGKKVVVFAPDPLSNVNGIEKFGFDEVTVMDEMESQLDGFSRDHLFIFKPHPNQDLDRLNKKTLDQMIVAPQDIDNNSLMYHSDIIIGFFSSYLLEAQIMNKKVLRYLPETAINDPFREQGVGIIVNRHTLKTHL